MTIAGFRARIDRSGGPTACWPWRGEKDRDGYGRLRTPRGRARAHRVALSIAVGRPLRPGMVAMHRCDHPPCCNPRHLLEGTRAENNRDMLAKRRHGTAAGERNPNAKLTNDSVQAILRRSADPAAAIARELGVHPATVSRVRRGAAWRAVSPNVARPTSTRRRRLDSFAAAAIRRSLAGGRSQRSLAREYRVAYNTIHLIAHGAIWRETAA